MRINKMMKAIKPRLIVAAVIAAALVLIFAVLAEGGKIASASENGLDYAVTSDIDKPVFDKPVYSGASPEIFWTVGTPEVRHYGDAFGGNEAVWDLNEIIVPEDNGVVDGAEIELTTPEALPSYLRFFEGKIYSNSDRLRVINTEIKLSFTAEATVGGATGYDGDGATKLVDDLIFSIAAYPLNAGNVSWTLDEDTETEVFYKLLPHDVVVKVVLAETGTAIALKPEISVQTAIEGGGTEWTPVINPKDAGLYVARLDLNSDENTERIKSALSNNGWDVNAFTLDNYDIDQTVLEFEFEIKPFIVTAFSWSNATYEYNGMDRRALVVVKFKDAGATTTETNLIAAVTFYVNGAEGEDADKPVDFKNAGEYRVVASLDSKSSVYNANNYVIAPDAENVESIEIMRHVSARVDWSGNKGFIYTGSAQLDISGIVVNAKPGGKPITMKILYYDEEYFDSTVGSAYDTSLLETDKSINFTDAGNYVAVAYFNEEDAEYPDYVNYALTEQVYYRVTMAKKSVRATISEQKSFRYTGQDQSAKISVFVPYVVEFPNNVMLLTAEFKLNGVVAEFNEVGEYTVSGSLRSNMTQSQREKVAKNYDLTIPEFKISIIPAAEVNPVQPADPGDDGAAIDGGEGAYVGDSDPLLSGGEIAAIVLGGLLGAALMVMLVYQINKRRRRSNRPAKKNRR
ncbi:MAG: hypothetical protein LBT55_07010 [Clostridiaceae bacterium]|jgi:hypothetical protein|nr:hypothetical protein [Clostridiaceae bacterium]